MKVLENISRKVRLLLLLVLCLSVKTLAQDISSVWKLDPLLEETKRHHKLTKSLKKSGFQIDQLALQKGELVLLFDQLPAVGKAFRRKKDRLVLTTASGLSLSLSRNELREQLYPQFQEKERGNTNKQHFYRALKGKRNTRRSSYQPYRLHFGRVDNTAYPYSFLFYRNKKNHTQLTFNSLPATQITELPFIAFSNCQPFDRDTYFRDISRRQYLGTDPYRYAPDKGVPRSKTFQLYFDKNKAEYKQEDLAGILKFLKDTLYVIEGAEIKAWASVEGSLENNAKLQEKRAEILISALEKHSGDSIPYEVETEEHWALFYAQLQKKEIDSSLVSKESWKERLSSPEEAQKWEPLLAEQRSASIKLYVTVKLTNEERQRQAWIYFQQLGANYTKIARQKKPSFIKTMLGIRNYFEEEALQGRLSADQLCKFYAHSNVYEYTLINFYEAADRFDKGELLLCDFQELALNAFNSIKSLYSYQLSLYRLKQVKPDPKVYGDLVSVQAYLYQKIIQKKLAPELACELFFPDDPNYYHLYLNYLKFTNALREDPSLEYDCFKASEGGEERASFDWRAVDADSRYYYMLKKIVLEGRVLDVVWRTDWMMEFDLFEFLRYNIYHWDPNTGYLFDQEVGVQEMATYTRQLLSSLKKLCPHQAYALAIAFHEKVLQQAYLQKQPDKQLAESLDFIEHFFIRHAAELEPEQATQIVRQLIGANSYSLRNERGRFAMDLLERVDSRKGLNSAQKTLYFELASSMGVSPKLER